jgi:hypothetical protein
LGYDTHNALLLLGTVGVALLYWVIRALICLVLTLIVKFKKDVPQKLKKYRKGLMRVVFFGELLSISIEGHLSLVIASYYNLSNPLYTTDGEIIANFFAYGSFLISIIILPSLLFWLLLVPV